MSLSGRTPRGLGPRTRLVALTTLGYLLAVGGAWFVVTTGMDGVVDEFEHEGLRADLNRAEAALYARLRELRAAAQDLARHTDAPVDAAPEERVIQLDATGAVQWSTGPDTLSAEPVLDALRAMLVRHPPPLSGLVVLQGEPALVASVPSGDGLLVIARPGASEAVEMASASGLSVALRRLAPETPFQVVDEDQIRGNRVIAGLDGAPAALLEITSPRSLHASATRMARAVILLFASLTALFSAVVAVLADRMFASALRHRESERLRARVVDHSTDGILLVTLNELRVAQANPAARALLPAATFGLSLAELIGLPLDTLRARLNDLDANSRVHIGEVALDGHDGRRTVEIHAWNLDDPLQPLLAVSLRDVTERRQEDARTRSLALRDPLTGLPNRTAFLEELARALGEASVSGRILAVLFLDLDGFKEVNDVLGHETADSLLVEVGRRLHSCVRAIDVVARQGGDEFLVLLPDLPSAEAASRTARRILEAIAAPYPLDGQPVRVGVSIGVACAPDDGTDASTLIEHADLAMYRAKELGRGGWQPFDSSLLDRARRAIALRRALTAFDPNDALTPVYLPQLDVRSGEVVAVQAAARWRSNLGSDEHEAVLAFAEQAGLATRLTEWLVDRAAADLSRLGESGLRVSIPVVGRPQMDELAERLRAAIAASLVPADRLELELTDAVFEREPARTRAALKELAREGVGLTLGRFGTAHGTFLGLRNLLVQRVKIDASLVEGAGADPASAALLAQLVRGATALGLAVTVCGVDTTSQLALVQRLGCDRIQGLQAGYSQGTPTVGETAREWARSSGTG